jgi:large subunit ribosomal protein L25
MKKLRQKYLLVLKQLDHVEVKALPKNLPDELVVDPSTLAEVGDHLTVADIKVPEGVTILTPLESSLAVVEMPKDQIAEANAIAAEQAETAGTTEQPGETTEGEEAAQPSESTEE